MSVKGNVSREFEVGSSKVALLVKQAVADAVEKLDISEVVKKQLEESLTAIILSTDNIEDGAVTLPKLDDDVVVKKKSVNILNPDNITYNPDDMYSNFFITDVKANKQYAVKINPKAVYSVWCSNSDGETYLNYSTIDGGIRFYVPCDSAELLVTFDNSYIDRADIDNFMVVESNALPDVYIPFGETEEYVVNQALVEQYLEKIYGDIVTTTENLFNPDNKSSSGSAYAFTISDLKAGLPYSFNFEPKAITAISTGDSVEYSANGTGGYTIENAPSGISISFDATVDYSRFMFVEGYETPSIFKPYGTSSHILDKLLSHIIDEISNCAPKVTTGVLASGGRMYLIKNHIYSLVTKAKVDFELPLTGENGDQILVQAEIQPGGEIIDWGTTHFFNNEDPTVEVGKYNFIFEFDSGAWYAGAIPKGQVE